MGVLAEIAIFTRSGGVMLSRWGHYLAGVTWIGLLYYFNFVQTPTMAQFEGATRTEVTQKLVPRALWWFRWGAVMTLLFGLSILWAQDQFNGDYFKSPGGISISTGILLALIMFLNVWLVIWPNQKVVIANAQGNPIEGKDPAVSARKGAVASRTNTLFSIPMLFFMGATSHFATQNFDTSENRGMFMGISALIILALEANALGVFGGVGPSPIRKYMDSHRDTIIMGFVLSIVLYALFEICFG